MAAGRVRRNIRVLEDRDEYGTITPVCIFHMGKKYTVDKVLDIQRKAATKAGGVGLCYTVRLSNEEESIVRQRAQLFLEIGAEPEVWFVEEKLHCCRDPSE